MGNEYTKLNQTNCGKIGDEDVIFEVLAFCDVGTRNKCLFLSKQYLRLLTTDTAFKWRLHRLHIECGVYSPNQLDHNQQNNTWKSIFLKLYRRRHIWQPSSLDNGFDYESYRDYQHTSNIKVCVRIKPKGYELSEQVDEDKVTLPLHQRLALIKISNNINSNREALSVLVQNGEWFGSKWTETNKKRSIDGRSGYEMENENALSIDQSSHHLKQGIHAVDSSSGVIIAVDAKKGIQEYNFDHVFDSDASQKQVYETYVQKLAGELINGFNCTVFTFGQTGSGKTHTMFGPPENIQRLHRHDKGIVPRLCEELLQLLEFRRKHLNFDTNPTIAVSYVEVFGNSIFDLLRNGATCGHNRAASQRHVSEGLAEIPVESIRDIMDLLQKGESQKRKAATAMNDRSTRAHSCFILNLKQTCSESNVSMTSRLFLVDLGGSEKTKKSKIDAGKSAHVEMLKQGTLGGSIDWGNYSSNTQVSNTEMHSPSSTGFVQSDRMREAVQINLGLLALKSCVEALNSGDKNRHIPYGNSKLTQLLSSGLGGNSKTIIIVCTSQETKHAAETIASLNFGHSCTGIMNEVRSGNALIQHMIHRLDDKISECESEIKLKEKWVVNEEARDDVNAEQGSLESEGFQGRELRKTTTLVGAEKERRILESLLEQRAKLTGVSLDSSLKRNTFGGHIGFGNANEYGMGIKYRASQDHNENYRFSERVNVEDLPTILQHRGSQSWKCENDLHEHGKMQINKKRSKLAYSGISA